MSYPWIQVNYFKISPSLMQCSIPKIWIQWNQMPLDCEGGCPGPPPRCIWVHDWGANAARLPSVWPSWWGKDEECMETYWVFYVLYIVLSCFIIKFIGQTWTHGPLGIMKIIGNIMKHLGTLFSDQWVLGVWIAGVLECWMSSCHPSVVPCFPRQGVLVEALAIFLAQAQRLASRVPPQGSVWVEMVRSDFTFSCGWYPLVI